MIKTKTKDFSSKEIYDFTNDLVDAYNQKELNEEFGLALSAAITAVLGPICPPGAMLYGAMTTVAGLYVMYEDFVDDTRSKIIAIANSNEHYRTRVQMKYDTAMTSDENEYFNVLEFDVIAIQPQADGPWIELM